ncbi:MAG TPA: FGGY-family carbohydrate kinase [Clostridia bacterium]|nr:FGGY-family carbohydrate kinase [Clostridia bacterium]
MYILSMDFGTSSLKLALLERDLRVVKSLKVEYQYRIRNQNWVELDAETAISAMCRGIRELSGYADKIELVSFDTFSPSVTLMDSEGEALYPIIMHLDRRSKDQSQRIIDEMGTKKFQSITGIQPFIGGASVTSILWLMENEPALFEKAYKVAHFNTYVYHRLTGRWATDPVNASMTGMYETMGGSRWSDAICGTFGIPEGKLPDILQAGTIAGSLTKQASQLTGLREGIPVALGSNDAATAQIGAGNTKAGDILDISGSSEMVSILSDKAVVNDKYYLRKAATPGLWQIFAITASGLAIDWFRREFYRDMDDKAFFSVEFPKIIGENITNSNIHFAPYIAGDRQSLEPKTATFSGITLQASRGDFLASILLGIHEPILETIRLAEAFLQLNRNVKLTGGMVHESFIGLKKKIMEGFDFTIVDNCPILGNAILALEGLNGRV